MRYRGPNGPYGDPWSSLGSLFVLLAALLVILTAWAIFQVGKHLGRAFSREPSNPVLWTLIVASLGLGGLTALLGAAGVTAAAAVAGVLAICSGVLLILVGITISLTSEKLLPTEPESLVTTAFKKSWW